MWRREEGGEDTGDQEEKKGNQMEREKSNQLSNPYVLSTVWNTQRGSRSYIEKRRGRPGFRGTLWVASSEPNALSTSNS